MTTEVPPERRLANRPSRGAVLRDTLSFILAWGLIFQQAWQPEKFHVEFLILAGIMSGVPAAVTAATVVLQRRTGTSTTSEASQSQP